MEAMEEHAPQPVAGGCPVVGIGASAGGLEALTALLSHVPDTTGLAYVVVQHLDPRAKSLLAGLLARATEMPVREVEEGMAVEPDRVYVCPANAELTLEEDVFHLSPHRQPSGRPSVIDRLLTSLSQARGPQAVGVLLSGTGSDGTAGLQTIRAAGGSTFAQDPTTATFAQMPQSAIEAGCVDRVLSPEEIARTLAQFVELAPLPQDQPTAPKASKSTEGLGWSFILHLLSQHSGVDFFSYKSDTLHRRIENRMVLLHFAHLPTYAAYLQAHPEEVEALTQSFLIAVTDFFRDPAVFEAFPRLVWPILGAWRETAGTAAHLGAGLLNGRGSLHPGHQSAGVSRRNASSRGRSRSSPAMSIPRCSLPARTGIYPADALEIVEPARVRATFRRWIGNIRATASSRRSASTVSSLSTICCTIHLSPAWT